MGRRDGSCGVVRVTSPDDPFDAWHGDDPEPPRRGLMQRLRDRGGRAIAVVLALFLVLPAAAWLIDVAVFRVRAGEVAEAVPELADAVALVTRRGCDGAVSTGSGFAVRTDRGPALITNRHVVEEASALTLRTLRGAPGPAVEAVLGAANEDVAVLLLAEPFPSELAFGAQVAVGDRIRLVGFPGARPVTTSGTVADVDGSRALLDIPVGAGASGAPLVDADGRVVAQVVARTAEGDGVAIATDALVTGVRGARPLPAC